MIGSKFLQIDNKIKVKALFVKNTMNLLFETEAIEVDRDLPMLIRPQNAKVHLVTGRKDLKERK